VRGSAISALPCLAVPDFPTSNVSLAPCCSSTVGATKATTMGAPTLFRIRFACVGTMARSLIGLRAIDCLDTCFVGLSTGWHRAAAFVRRG
jgi:hypothetical protein